METANKLLEELDKLRTMLKEEDNTQDKEQLKYVYFELLQYLQEIDEDLFLEYKDKYGDEFLNDYYEFVKDRFYDESLKADLDNKDILLKMYTANSLVHYRKSPHVFRLHKKIKEELGSLFENDNYADLVDNFDALAVRGIKIKENKTGENDSSFKTVISRFKELAFLDYYKEDIPLTYLTNMYQLFDELSCVVEHTNDTILNLTTINRESHRLEGKNEGVGKTRFDGMISDYVAIYMFNVYKNNLDEFQQFYQSFSDNLGKSDQAIWDLIDVEMLKTALSEEVTAYNDGITYTRPSKKRIRKNS